MKMLLGAIAMAICCGLAGCAGSSDPLFSEAADDLERGVTGGGTLYVPEKQDDPFIDAGR